MAVLAALVLSATANVATTAMPSSTSAAAAHTGANFLTAFGATFGFGETLGFEEGLFAGVENEAGVTVLAMQHLVAGLQRLGP
jgi:hypothetical protein